MKRALLALFLLAGCVERPEATHEPMTAADGQRAMMVTCPRSRRECLAEAATVCPNGYAILDEEAQQQLRSTPSAVAFSAYNGNLVPRTIPGQAYTVYHGEMLVRCQRAEEAE